MAKGNKTGKGGFGDNPQNINKEGRPSLSEQFRILFEQKMSKDKLVEALAELCKNGDKVAIMYALDRNYGKVKEQIEHEVPEGIEIIIRGERKK